jgi:hypothetical protein
VSGNTSFSYVSNVTKKAMSGDGRSGADPYLATAALVIIVRLKARIRVLSGYCPMYIVLGDVF